jgi:hypothetical protein
MAKRDKGNKATAPITAAQLDSGGEGRVIEVGGVEVDDSGEELDDDEGDDDELGEGERVAAAPPLPDPPRVQQPPAPVMAFQQVVPHQPRDIYRPDSKRHLSECGPVAMGNWCGVVKGRRQDVHFGAPRSRIPAEVQAAMAKSGVHFGRAPRPEPKVGTGAQVVSRGREAAGPRARRTERRAAEPEKAFRPVPVSAIGAAF